MVRGTSRSRFSHFTHAQNRCFYVFTQPRHRAVISAWHNAALSYVRYSRKLSCASRLALRAFDPISRGTLLPMVLFWSVKRCLSPSSLNSCAFAILPESPTPEKTARSVASWLSTRCIVRRRRWNMKRHCRTPPPVTDRATLTSSP